MTTLTIEELEPGGSVELLAVLRDVSMRTTKAGKPYLTMTLGDRTGEIQGRAWDEAPQLHALVSAGDAVVVRGLVETFGEQLQIKVRRLDPHPWDEETRRMLLPASNRDIDEMWAELKGGIAEITDPALRTFLETFVEAPGIRPGYRTAPAAKVVHHAWVGGLLEHTVSMLAAARLLADHYLSQVTLDRDLLIAGVVLHDVGKIIELGGDGSGGTYTTRGRFVGHMGLGVQLLERHRTAGHPLADETLDRLVHMVLSHHGDQEKGSPIRPVTVEGHLLHHVDMLDSRMAMAAKLLQDVGSDGWTRPDRFLGGALYYNPDAENGAGRTSSGSEGSEAPPTGDKASGPVTPPTGDKASGPVTPPTGDKASGPVTPPTGDKASGPEAPPPTPSKPTLF
jgi:3'-5' exoribonuclease